MNLSQFLFSLPNGDLVLWTFTLTRTNCNTLLNLPIARAHAVGIRVTLGNTFSIIIVAYINTRLSQMKFTRNKFHPRHMLYRYKNLRTVWVNVKLYLKTGLSMTKNENTEKYPHFLQRNSLLSTL